ncbi:hypothetical protein ACOSQ4_024323 [Xanthoceras sorbifolium]
MSFFSAEMGEFLALREGLILANSLGLSIFEAEVDASNVASAVNLSSNCCGDASFIVNDIKALCLEVGNCSCLAIPRSGNRLAHVLASIAFSSGVDQSCASNNSSKNSPSTNYNLAQYSKSKSQSQFLVSILCDNDA